MKKERVGRKLYEKVKGSSIEVDTAKNFYQTNPQPESESYGAVESPQ